MLLNVRQNHVTKLFIGKCNVGVRFMQIHLCMELKYNYTYTGKTLLLGANCDTL